MRNANNESITCKRTFLNYGQQEELRIMKTTKVLGTVLFTAILAVNTVSASAANEPSPIQLPQPQANVTAVPLDSYGGLNFLLVINGQGLTKEEAPIYVGAQNTIMIPIRVAAEALGYKLTWKQENQALELVKGNQWLSLQIGQDKYSFAKMNVPLGVVPELVNEKTYVPLSYFEKVLNVAMTVAPTGTITITSKDSGSESVDALTKQGSVTSITYRENGDGEIGLNGYGHGIRLTISKETEIVSADNKKLTLADLKLGMSIEATHSMVMAMSMPPLTNAKKILVKDALADTPTLGTAGEIQEVSAAEDGTVRLLVKGEKLSDNSFELVALNVGSSTQVIGTKDNQPVAVDQLKQGDKVYAFYGPILTKSLPPIGTAAKILVEN
jgi:hypothetical protein